MENQKVYEIIKLEKQIDRNKAATILSTSLLTLITGVEVGVALTCAHQNNIGGAIFNGMMSLLAGGITIGGYKVMSNETDKIRNKVKTLKRSAGIDENR